MLTFCDSCDRLSFLGENMLTKERLHELFFYNNGWLYRKISKGCAKKGSKVGTVMVEKQTRYRCDVDGKGYYLHRLIFLYHHGYLPERIDHINGDPTDNRIENLREATQSKNMMNAKLFNTNTSGVKGVSFDKRTKTWAAYVWKNYARIWLGRFPTLEQAKQAVTEARVKYHKEFANHG